MRLIDLDALLKFPIRIDHYDKANGNEHFIFGIETVIEYAENLPIVDAVPVVRCKDCEHMTLEMGARFCNVWERFNGMGDEGFCNYGERKEND